MIDNRRGFTIVELLIVIVIIGILTAITIVAYNGITVRASTTAANSDLKQNAELVMAAQAISGQYSTQDVMPGGAAAAKMNMSSYKVVTYCTNGVDFIYALQTTNGNTYYIQDGNTPTNNNSLNIYDPCGYLGLSGSSHTTFANLPSSSCAGETGSCTFSGTATVVFGSVSQASFTYKTNQTSPVACTNSYFGIDPASGYTKACYVYPN